MFKVVTDQLKVSQGWVRCGQCADVFDASLHLHSMPLHDMLISEDPESKEAALLTSSTSSAISPSLVAPAEFEVKAAALSPETLGSQHEDVWLPGVSFANSSPLSLPAWHSALNDRDAVDADFDPSEWKQRQRLQYLDELGKERLNPQGAAAGGASREQPVLTVPVPALDAGLADRIEPFPSGATDDPSFVRDAKREAFWRKPAVRIALLIPALLFALLLVVQVLVQQRNSFAAILPGLTPVLQTLCEYLECEIGPLRRIEAVVIESSSFNKIGKDVYRLSFSLKNTYAAAVAMPSLEVTLTDSQEQALLRRVITPLQFGATTATLAAGGDFAGVVTTQVSGSDPSVFTGPAARTATATGAPRVAGYRVLAFYP